MINLKRFFRPNPYLLTVSKTQKETLEYFISNKILFEDWSLLQQQQRVKFQFYFPTAVDFYFDDFKLFTAYFKKGQQGHLELQEIKMSEVNYNSIRSSNWQPFEEVILDFLNSLEEKNKIVLFRKTKSLHEYAAICEKTNSPESTSHSYKLDLRSSAEGS